MTKEEAKGYKYLLNTLDFVRSKTYPPCLYGKNVKEAQKEMRK